MFWNFDCFNVAFDIMCSIGGSTMGEVIIQGVTFIIIICIGFILKKVGVFKKEDANVLATIIMNITLPCALLSSANGIEMSPLIFVLILMGILANVITIFIGYFISRKEHRVIRGVYMLNTSGFNIGNFVLPFVQAFFPGMGVIYLCSFDIGNAIMGLGITYALASYVASGESDFKLSDLFKKLFSSIPFDVYIIIFILSIFKLSIPDPIVKITSIIGAGNGTLAMLMIGILLEIKISKRERKMVFHILTYRVLAVIFLALVTYFVLPIPILAKQILILAYVAPLSTVASVFSKRIGYEGDLPAATNSLTIIISMCCTLVLLLIFV